MWRAPVHLVAGIVALGLLTAAAVTANPIAAAAEPLDVGAPGRIALTLGDDGSVALEGWTVEVSSSVVGCTPGRTATTDSAGGASFEGLALGYQEQGDRGPRYCEYRIRATSPDGLRQTVETGESVVAASAPGFEVKVLDSTRFVGVFDTQATASGSHVGITNWAGLQRRLDRFAPVLGAPSDRFQSFQARCHSLGLTEGSRTWAFSGIAADSPADCARFTGIAPRAAEQASISFDRVVGPQPMRLGPNLIGMIEFRGNGARDALERVQLRVDSDVRRDGATALIPSERQRWYQFMPLDGDDLAAGGGGLTTFPFNGVTARSPLGELLYQRVDLHPVGPDGSCPVASIGTPIRQVPHVLPPADAERLCLYSQWFMTSFEPLQLTLPINRLPVIDGALDVRLPVGSSFDALSGVSALDYEDGDLTESIVVDGAVDGSLPGVFALSYQVVDSSGGVATAQRRIEFTALSEDRPSPPAPPRTPIDVPATGPSTAPSTGPPTGPAPGSKSAAAATSTLPATGPADSVVAVAAAGVLLLLLGGALARRNLITHSAASR